MPTIQNLSPIPLPPATGSLGSGLIGASGLQSNGSTYTPRLPTSGPNGGPCWDITANSATGLGIGFQCDSTQMSLNTQYVFTVLVNAPVNGTQIQLASSNMGTGTSTIRGTQINTLGQWTQISFAATTGTAWSGIPTFWVDALGSSNANPIEFYCAKTMIAPGFYLYADGDTAGWSWSGTSGISPSSGPAIVANDLTPPAAYGQIIGRFLEIDADADGDLVPDGNALVGTVVLYPIIGHTVIPTASGNVHVSLRPITASLDANGYVAYNGAYGFSVLAGLTWMVEFHLSTQAGVPVSIPSYSFSVPSFGVIDLTTVTRL